MAKFFSKPTGACHKDMKGKVQPVPGRVLPLVNYCVLRSLQGSGSTPSIWHKPAACPGLHPDISGFCSNIWAGSCTMFEEP